MKLAPDTRQCTTQTTPLPCPAQLPSANLDVDVLYQALRTAEEAAAAAAQGAPAISAAEAAAAGADGEVVVSRALAHLRASLGQEAEGQWMQGPLAAS